MRNRKPHISVGLQIKMFKIRFFSFYGTVFGEDPRVGVKTPYLGSISATTEFLDMMFENYTKNWVYGHTWLRNHVSGLIRPLDHN